MDLMKEFWKLAKENPQRIVLAEGEEERTIKAAEVIVKNSLAKLILIGDETKIRDNKLNKTEAAALNKSAFLQKLRRFNENSAILEVQKSGIIEENLNEISEMYCRGMVEIEKFFKEVIR